MSKFNNATPVVDIQFDAIEPSTEVIDLNPNGLDIIETDPNKVENKEVEIEESGEGKESVEGLDVEDVLDDITPVDPEPEPTDPYADNVYLKTINSLFDKGLLDPENLYEGFTDDTEPTEEVLEKFVEHNYELRERKALEEFVESVSPLTQRILSYDLNSKGENVEGYLRTLIEENSIKSLSVDNEYDQEKIVRLFYSDADYSDEEIEEKVEELKSSSLLEKEAKRIKPKLDLKAEAIAKEQEESEAVLRQIETQAKNQFFEKIEPYLKEGKVNNLTLSKEVAQKVGALLMVDNVKVKLPHGKEVKMNYLEAEILKHKFSSKGDPALLIQAAFLLADPEGFYKQFANAAKTKEVNEFVSQAKYNVKRQSQPMPETKTQKKEPSKHIPWNKPPVNR